MRVPEGVCLPLGIASAVPQSDGGIFGRYATCSSRPGRRVVNGARLSAGYTRCESSCTASGGGAFCESQSLPALICTAPLPLMLRVPEGLTSGRNTVTAVRVWRKQHYSYLRSNVSTTQGERRNLSAREART